jgi:hypothetical protein
MFKTFFPKIVLVVKYMCKNMLQPDRPQMTNITPHMRFAYWITKATYTCSKYVTRYFNTVKMVTGTRLKVTLYIHRLSCSQIISS